MARVIYGLDTESIEDYEQCVVVDVPDDVDDVEGWFEEQRGDEFAAQPVVGWHDVTEALALILAAPPYSYQKGAVRAVIDALFDAVDNAS